MNKSRYQTIALFPLLLSCLYLLSSTFYQEIEHALDTSILPGLLSFIFILALFVPCAMGLIKRNFGPFRLGFKFICALTPLSLIYPWAVVPGNLGMSYGGYAFFLEWLTKYPNFGPINIQVFLGILCVSVSSLLPAILCYLYNFKTHYRKVIIAAAIIETAAYIPVLIKLDWLLLLSGIMGNSWFGGGTIRDLTVVTGPAMRLVSFLMISGTAIAALRKYNYLTSCLPQK